ncbi:MAG: GDSL-type esterase/lipase family protein [Bacteroidota bacterium]
MKKTFLVLILFFLINLVSSQEKEPALNSTHRLDIEWWKERHEEKMLSPQINPRLVLLGNSILHTLDYSDRNDVWQKYLRKYRALNLGFSGDRTENVIWRLENGEIDNVEPKLVLLLIGTNNTDGNHFLSITQPDELQNAVWKITRIIRNKLPEAKILLLGILPYGYKANYRDNLNKKTNTYLADFPKKDDNIIYKDIGEIFFDDQGKVDKTLMPDYLHPNAAGHLLMFKTLEPVIEELIGE